MAKFNIIVPPFTGHINPTLGLGKALLENGHQVVWISVEESLADLLPEGGELMPIPRELIESEKKKRQDAIDRANKNTTYGLDSLKFLYEEILLPFNEFLLSILMSSLDKESVDMIITDHQVMAGAVAAKLKGIPYATSVTAPAAIKVSDTLPQVYHWESEQVVKFQKKHGIDEDERIDISQLATFVYTSREFFGDKNMPEYYRFIGPVINTRPNTVEFDWELLSKTENPKVLVSIGTTFDHNLKLRFFEKVIEAFGNEQITVILVTDPKLFETIPSNFIVQESVPQLELLSQVQAVICHGGFNTVSESLSNGLPLVVLPIAYDQSYVAGRVTDVNAGIRVNFNRFKPVQLREALWEVLRDKKYAANALTMRQSFIDAGGVNRAVSDLEEILNIIKK